MTSRATLASLVLLLSGCIAAPGRNVVIDVPHIGMQYAHSRARSVVLPLGYVPVDFRDTASGIAVSVKRNAEVEERRYRLRDVPAVLLVEKVDRENGEVRFSLRADGVDEAVREAEFERLREAVRREYGAERVR